MKTIALFSMCIWLISCKSNENNEKVILEKFHLQGNHIIKEIYDSLGNIQLKQSYNNDTIPDGVMMEYYPNGKIAAWRWFVSNERNPTCGVFYYDDGSFDTLKGHPILDAVRNQNGFVSIKTLTPPGINCMIRFIEYDKGKKIKEEDYELIVTDSTTWITLNKYNLNGSSNFKLFFCIVDTLTENILHAYPQSLVVPTNE